MGAPLVSVPQWQPLDLVVGGPWPSRLKGVLLALNVEQSPRYKPGHKLDAKGGLVPASSVTWCNVYVTDIIAAMGVSAPRHWVTSSGEPAAIGKGVELSANRLIAWFDKHGARYGWMRSDSRTAQEAARRGHLVIVGWSNPKPALPGHVSVVLGPDRITSAGRRNFYECTVKESFGLSVDAPALRWFVQTDRPGGHGS